MRTSEERITELHRRMGMLARNKQLRRIRSIYTGAVVASLALILFLSLGVSQKPMKVVGIVPAFASASIFANHAALRYIVVGTVALCLGVLVTLFCLRLKRSMENEEQSDD